MTLEQVSYNILNSITGGRSTNNEYISLEQIKFQVKYYRSLLIRRDQERNRKRRELEQELGTLSLTTINKSSNDNLAGKSVLRTNERIPTPVRLKGEDALYVSTTDHERSFSLTSHKSSHWKSTYSKYANYTDSCYLLDGYIYINYDGFTDKLNQRIKGEDVEIEGIPLDSVYVRGIFEDPTEVFIFNDEDESNQPFPLPVDMIEQVTKSIIGGELNSLLQTPSDLTHDNLPDRQINNSET